MRQLERNHTSTQHTTLLTHTHSDDRTIPKFFFFGTTWRVHSGWPEVYIDDHCHKLNAAGGWGGGDMVGTVEAEAQATRPTSKLSWL
jgi:hypothetical protein